MSGVRRAALALLLAALPAGSALAQARAGGPASAPAPAPSAASPAAMAAGSEAAGAELRGRFTLSRAAEQGGLVHGHAPEGAVRVTLDGRPVPLTGDGRFLIAFGRDHPPSARLEALMPDGATVRADLPVAQRQWQIQRLPGRLGAIEAAPAFEERRAAELARVRAARARADLGLPHWREPFQWPVTGRISGVYGSQRIIGDTPRAPHFGVDIARPIGTPVVAPAGGVVLLASPPIHTIEGNLVLLDHGMGLVSSFLHLDRVDVVAGQRVARGEPIGTVGTTGRSTGPHLHWGMTLGDVRIDPARLVPPMATMAPPAPSAPVASGR
jgi:hypothetical protein